jgi:hypothetical protein
MRKQLLGMFIVLLFSLVALGCATGGQVSGDGSATGGTNNTVISNFPCVRLGNLTIGCDNQTGSQQNSKSPDQGATSTASSQPQPQSGTACGPAAMNMSCPSIAIPGTNCRRCQ